MTNFLATVGAEVKALAKFGGTRDVFRNTATATYGVSYGSLGNQLITQSAQLDLGRVVGDPLSNSVVAACVSAIARALPDAPLLLEENVKGNWQPVNDHDCLEPLRSPNPDHSDADIWALTAGYKATRGQAFWLLLPNNAGRLGEIYVWKPEHVTVQGDENTFISGYRVQKESGGFMDVSREQVIQFCHLRDFDNSRLGWSPLRTAGAQVAGDNLAATYSTSILYNAGVVSLLVSLKDAAAANLVNPDQFEAVLSNVRKATREKAGGVIGMNVPLEVTKMGYSPDEMGISELTAFYERRICMAMEVSPRVAGIGADPTYNNLKEALNDFWERRIVPDRNADAATLNRQYLPLWGMDRAKWRFRFDFSNVPALQENKDEIHNRVRSDFEKQICDKREARALLGYAGTPEMEQQFQGVFFGGGAPAPEATPEGEEEGTEAEMKAAASRGWQTQPRDDLGRWTDGAGNLNAAHVATVMHAEGIHESHHGEVLEKIRRGEHKTRADVLAHIDAIHATGKAGEARQAGRAVWNAESPKGNLSASEMRFSPNGEVIRGMVGDLPIIANNFGRSSKDKHVLDVVTPKTKQMMESIAGDPSLREALSDAGIHTVSVVNKRTNDRQHEWTMGHSNGELLIHPRSAQDIESSTSEVRKKRGFAGIIHHEAGHGLWNNAPTELHKTFGDFIDKNPELVAHVSSFLNVKPPRNAWNTDEKERLHSEMHAELHAMQHYDPARFSGLPAGLQDVVKEIAVRGKRTRHRFEVVHQWQPSGKSLGMEIYDIDTSGSEIKADEPLAEEEGPQFPGDA